MTQPTLFDERLAEWRAGIVPEKRSTLNAFRDFHAANPNVYSELVTLARKLRARGHQRYSIAGLFEVLRFRHALKTVGDDRKLNNSYKPYFARLIMENEPDLRGFFETRKQKDVA